MELYKFIVAAANRPAFDSAEEVETNDAGAAYLEADLKIATATAIQQWAEADDLGDGEGVADRLVALFVGIADANKDGDITDEEAEILDEVLEDAYDYLVSLGVDEDDVSALLNDFDEQVAVRVQEFIISALPDGEEESQEHVNAFAFGGEALDAAYKKVMAVRGGKKVRINKRISGTVRLSAKQKVAIRKARMKSHSAKAMIKRARSMRLRKKMGL